MAIKIANKMPMIIAVNIKLRFSDCQILSEMIFFSKNSLFYFTVSLVGPWNEKENSPIYLCSPKQNSALSLFGFSSADAFKLLQTIVTDP